MTEYFPLPIIDAPQPPPFEWEGWYGAVGGRTIDIPEVEHWMQRIKDEQYPRFNGPTAPHQLQFESSIMASSWVKSSATAYGADIVGICKVDARDVYQDRTVPHRYAIVVGSRMFYDAFVTVPSESAAVECMRVYHSLGETVIALAETLRKNGHTCTIEHPLGDSSVLHIPLALKAGFGELGRHGSIINPTFGPLFRIGSVLTDLELACDAPIDVGIGAFCDHCKACRMFCPADAIPDERSAEHGLDPQGFPRYVVDTGKCFPYFATANYCSACLATCAYQHKVWARLSDDTVGPFPDVPFGDVPPSVDPTVASHAYPRLRRTSASPHHRKA